MKRILSWLICLCLLIPAACVGEGAPSFDDTALSKLPGYTLNDDGTWRCEAGAVVPYPRYDVYLYLIAEGVRGGACKAPVLVAGLFKSGTKEPAKAVSGVELAVGHQVYTFKRMQSLETTAELPLYTYGEKVLSFLAKADKLTVVVYYNDGNDNMNVLGQLYLNAMRPFAKALTDGHYMDYVKDEDGSLTELNEQYPLTERTTP